MDSSRYIVLRFERVTDNGIGGAAAHGRREGELPHVDHERTRDRRGTPQLNGKVERSHRSDRQEFYQLLAYKGDVDLEAKLEQRERFYNFARPHGAHNGQTPYEALRERLS